MLSCLSRVCLSSGTAQSAGSAHAPACRLPGRPRAQPIPAGPCTGLPGSLAGADGPRARPPPSLDNLIQIQDEYVFPPHRPTPTLLLGSQERMCPTLPCHPCHFIPLDTYPHVCCPFPASRSLHCLPLFDCVLRTAPMNLEFWCTAHLRPLPATASPPASPPAPAPRRRPDNGLPSPRPSCLQSLLLALLPYPSPILAAPTPQCKHKVSGVGGRRGTSHTSPVGPPSCSAAGCDISIGPSIRQCARTQPRHVDAMGNQGARWLALDESAPRFPQHPVSPAQPILAPTSSHAEPHRRQCPRAVPPVGAGEPGGNVRHCAVLRRDGGPYRV